MEQEDALLDIVRKQILEAHQDGMKLGIRSGAKILREVAEGCASDDTLSPDYICGLHDAAVLMDRFSEDVK